MSNSHLIMGKNEAILIDAQFSSKEAEKLVDLINTTGKKLSKIIITHPHPDHYYGLEVLGVKYGDTEITGGLRTIDYVKNTMKYWQGDKEEPPIFGRLTVLEGNSFKFEDRDVVFKTFTNGESIENTVLYIPSLEMLFVGDLASNGVHMWLGENNLDKWLEQLRIIRSIGPISYIYPGHGPVGTVDILDEAERYILNFRNTLKDSNSFDEAVKRMKELYPDYEMTEILEGSVRSVMGPDNKIH
ncbi:MAG: MBL fold metallo-hydrolase [Deltaproteobacteria bacterium]